MLVRIGIPTKFTPDAKSISAFQCTHKEEQSGTRKRQNISQAITQGKIPSSGHEYGLETILKSERTFGGGEHTISEPANCSYGRVRQARPAAWRRARANLHRTNAHQTFGKPCSIWATHILLNRAFTKRARPKNFRYHTNNSLSVLTAPRAKPKVDHHWKSKFAKAMQTFGIHLYRKISARYDQKNDRRRNGPCHQIANVLSTPRHVDRTPVMKGYLTQLFLIESSIRPECLLLTASRKQRRTHRTKRSLRKDPEIRKEQRSTTNDLHGQRFE